MIHYCGFCLFETCEILLVCEDGDIDETSTTDWLQYSFGIIKQATDDFSENNKLGQGGFGLVYKVNNKL